MTAFSERKTRGLFFFLFSFFVFSSLFSFFNCLCLIFLLFSGHVDIVSDSDNSISLPSISNPLSEPKLVAKTAVDSNLNVSIDSTAVAAAAVVAGNWPANGQTMTVREYDAKLNELRKENFSLKLRIYFLETEKFGTSTSQPGQLN